MVQILPQVKVFQEFTLVPTPVVEPLRAFIVGPHYNTRTYATDKTSIVVGDYQPGTDTVVSWPGRQAGEVVDLASAEVTIEDALVRYYSQNSGGIGYDPVSPNIVTLGGAYGWATAGAFARLPTLIKDVEVGDYVRLTDPDNLGSTMLSVVRGLSRVDVASSLPAQSSVVSGNTATSSATSTPVSAPGGSAFSVTVQTGAYKPYKLGITSDRYTFTVTTPGAPGTAKFSVTTASGLDVQSDVSLAAGVALSVGALGLTVTFTGAGTVSYGDTWVFDVTSAFTAPTGSNLAISGTYAGPADTTYVIKVVTGGVVGTDSPTFTVSTSTGIESAGPFAATTGATAISAFGDDPVKVTFANGIHLCAGDRFSVAAVAASLGRVDKLELADTIPTALYTLADVNIEVLAKKTASILAKRYASPSIPNFVAGESSITLKSGITFYEAGSVLNGLPIRAGTVYVGYRALSPVWTEEVQTISDVSQLTTYFADLTPANPLAFGVKKALENANGTDVKFIAVESDDVEGYTTALSKTLEREDVYSVVPMSNDPAVKSLVIGHVTSQSAPEKGRWRIAWVANQVETEKQVVGATSVVATITQYAGDAAGVYRLVSAAAGQFWTNAVKAGDELRYAYGVDELGAPTYSTGVVDRVISETQLLVLDGVPAQVTIASKIEIWRALSTAEQVTELVAANSYANRRVFSVLTGGVTADGFVGQADYFTAAALAGLRSGVAPHQGLTNVAVTGIEATPYTTKTLTGTQLDELANAGYWIVRQDTRSGSIYTRKQLSTDLTDLNTQEQSITTNVDSLSYYFKLSLSPYIGRTNNVDSVRSLIKSDLGAAFEFFFSNGTPTLGAQLLDGTQILELRPHAVLADTLVIKIRAVIPAPINVVELYIIA